MKAPDAHIHAVGTAVETTNCLTRIDISAASGLNLPQVDLALATVRRPAVQKRFGWTIPYVRRGAPGWNETYRYQKMILDASPLAAADFALVRSGNRSTVSGAATSSEGSAAQMKAVAAKVDPRQARVARRLARQLDNVAVELREFVEDLDGVSP